MHAAASLVLALLLKTSTMFLPDITQQLERYKREMAIKQSTFHVFIICAQGAAGSFSSTYEAMASAIHSNLLLLDQSLCSVQSATLSAFHVFLFIW